MSRVTTSPMHRRLRGLAIAVLGMAVLVAGTHPVRANDRPDEIPYETEGEVPLLDPSYRMESHKVVLITDHALNPRRVQLNKGQLVAWISYAKLPSVVVFERETAKKMICHSLVNFTIADDEIRSEPIHAGEFASFCQLQPGRYVYKIVRPDTGDRSASASRFLRGEIVVSSEEADDDKDG